LRTPASAAAQVALGAAIVIALDALVISVARAVDPGAPLIMVSNVVALFIGVIQLLWGVPLVLWQRRRRPALAVGMALGMALMLVLTVVALYH
jgi:hypothetical protein